MIRISCKPKYPVCGFIEVPKDIARLAKERIWALVDRNMPIQQILENAYIIGLMDAAEILEEKLSGTSI